MVFIPVENSNRADHLLQETVKRNDLRLFCATWVGYPSPQSMTWKNQQLQNWARPVAPKDTDTEKRWRV